MNCEQRSLLRGLISLSSPKAIESEHSGYGKCLEKISTSKQALGGVQSKLSQLFSLRKPKQGDGESSSSLFKPQPLVSRKHTTLSGKHFDRCDQKSNIDLYVILIKNISQCDVLIDAVLFSHNTHYIPTLNKDC
jgi:hypothetical protein